MNHLGLVTAPAAVSKPSDLAHNHVWIHVQEIKFMYNTTRTYHLSSLSNKLHYGCTTYQIPPAPKIGARRNPTLGWLLIAVPDIN